MSEPMTARPMSEEREKLRITDADLQRALAYYRSTPTRVWGDRMVAALTELAEHRSRSITEEERERALKAAAEFLPMEGDDHCCREPEQGFPGWTCCGMRGEHPDFIEFARKNAIFIARALLTTSDALKACEGYLLNAKIDLETGTKKATTIATLEGGLRRVRAALATKGEG